MIAVIDIFLVFGDQSLTVGVKEDTACLHIKIRALNNNTKISSNFKGIPGKRKFN